PTKSRAVLHPGRATDRWAGTGAETVPAARPAGRPSPSPATPRDSAANPDAPLAARSALEAIPVPDEQWPRADENDAGGRLSNRTKGQIRSTTRQRLALARG